MAKLIGYARASPRALNADRQVADLLAAGVDRLDLYTDRVTTDARADRSEFDRALAALRGGDTLVITTLDRLGRTTADLLDFATELQDKGVNLRVLNLGGSTVDTSTFAGGMVFTVMAGLAQMEFEIKRERIREEMSKARAAGKDLGGRHAQYTDIHIRDASRLIDGGERAADVARDLGISCATLYRRITEVEAQQWMIVST